MNQIAIRYEYRDASNYHRSGEVVFTDRGRIPARLVEGMIRAALDDGAYFIARQVDVPEVFMRDYPFSHDDHSWHAFERAEATDNEPNDESGRDIAEFISDMRAAKATRWDWKQIPQELLVILLDEAPAVMAELMEA